MKAKERFEVLLEDMNGKIKFIAEGHMSLSRQIQESREEVKKDNEETRALFTFAIKDLYSSVKNLDTSVKDLNKKVDAVDKKVDVVDKKVDAVDKKVDSVKQELIQKIDAVDKKVDRTREELGGKIDKLIEISEDHEERIKTLELVR